MTAHTAGPAPRIEVTTHPAWRRPSLLAALLALTALRLGVAAATPLAPDETYYWVWSRALAPGYLDHPPMVALWIRIGDMLAGEGSLGIRLLAPIGTALGTILLADAAERLFPARNAGLRAAVLLNATLMLGAGSVLMTPDTPLLFFWTLTIWALARVAAHPAWWLAAGLATGAALASKYTAGLLGIGIALWLLTPAMRPWLLRPWPWLGGALAIAGFAPVIVWNANHGWAGFLRQGGRAANFEPARAPQFLAELIGGQIGLATPLIVLLFVAGTAQAARRWRSPASALAAALVLPGTALFLQHAIGDRVQANWVAVLYPGAALAAAALPPRPAFDRAATALGFAITALVYLQATLAPLPLPRSADPTLRLAGWPAFADRLDDLARDEGASFLAAEEYGTAALLAHAGHTRVVAAELRWRFFDLPPANDPGPGLLLLSSRRREPPNPAIWATAEPRATLARTARGLEIETFRLYRVTLSPGAAAVILPSPTRSPKRSP